MSMRVKTWRILDYGRVPESSATVPFSCACGHEAELPVKGRVIAQFGDGGVVFDNDCKGELPTTIQCRKCRRILTNEKEASDVR